MSSAPPLARFEYHRIIMAAPCNLVLYAPEEATADRAARAAFDCLAQLDETLSDWMPSSEVRRLPSRAGISVVVSPTLAVALERSLDYARASDGAFDPTVGALTKLWRAAREHGAPPPEEAVAAARERCGWQRLSFDPATRTLMLLSPGVELDFGGIGQGIGADAALEAMAALGVTRALVDLSGDIAVGDAPPDRAAWSITVEDAQGDAPRTLALVHAAVTTSGDRFQHMDVQTSAHGIVRLSHIVDPRTGALLTTRTAVTVVARRATDADALATALCVLGPKASAALLAHHPDATAWWATEAAP